MQLRFIMNLQEDDKTYDHMKIIYLKLLNHVRRDNMTNTYNEFAPNDVRVAEELRLIRCLIERTLRLKNEAMFVDYQMEKFGADYKP